MSIEGRLYVCYKRYMWCSLFNSCYKLLRKYFILVPPASYHASWFRCTPGTRQHEVLGVWEPWLLSVRTLDRVVGGPRVMMQREANIAGKILISALTGGFKSRISTQDIRQLGKRKSSQGNFKWMKQLQCCTTVLQRALFGADTIENPLC